MLNLGFALLLQFSFNSLAPFADKLSLFDPSFFHFLSLSCKGCVSLGVYLLQSKRQNFLNLIIKNHQL